ncbi:MAG: FAD:protein FMN transferase [Candidatus Falkowbacteria bacterium]
MITYKKIKALGTEIEFCLQSNINRNFEYDLKELEFFIVNFEKRFSRFLTSSELSLLNRAGGAFKASSELIDLLSLAQDFYKTTKGIFDPTILKTLEKKGYDKSFDSADFNHDIIKEDKYLGVIDFSQVEIDLAHKLITLPSGLAIDLGGIGKGYLVDLLVTKIKAKGYRDFWISAGGDMYLSGLNQDQKPYQVAVQNPKKLAEDIFNLTIINRELAVATSGVAKRQWLNNGKQYNHIIDPRTGLSVDNNLLAVTVVSDQAVKADIYAKTILILGVEQGLAFINRQANSEALIIGSNLELSLSKNMNNYLTKI